MYVRVSGFRKRLCQLEIDKPIRLNIRIRAALLLVMIVCGAHALNYINATGRNLGMYTSINIVSLCISF